MPRQPRIHVDHLPLHIVQRGHNHAPCFLADRDFASYLRWLGCALHEFQCALHAYVLMTNHVHLLLTPARTDRVPRLIMSIGRRYVQYFNRTHDRSGTLWDSRYKSSLVDSEQYLLACHRYIELNPVRAGLARDPADYRWSSYRANALDQHDPILTPHSLYVALARDDQDRRQAYRGLFREADDETTGAIRGSLRSCRPLGDSDFQSRVESETGIRPPRPRGRPSRQQELPARPPQRALV